MTSVVGPWIPRASAADLGRPRASIAGPWIPRASAVDPGLPSASAVEPGLPGARRGGPWAPKGLGGGPWAPKGLGGGAWAPKGLGCGPWAPKGLRGGPLAPKGVSGGPWASSVVGGGLTPFGLPAKKGLSDAEIRDADSEFVDPDLTSCGCGLADLFPFCAIHGRALIGSIWVHPRDRHLICVSLIILMSEGGRV